MRILNVLIVNSHQLFRQGLRALFEDRADFRVMGDVDNLAEAMEIVAKEAIDVVIVDLVLAGIYERQVITDLKAQRSTIKILVLTGQCDLANAANALADNADGFLSMGCDFDELAAAVRQVDAGERYICSNIAHELAMKAISPGRSRLPSPLAPFAIGGLSD